MCLSVLRRPVFIKILVVMAFAPAHSACGLALCTLLFANTQLAQMAPAMAGRCSATTYLRANNKTLAEASAKMSNAMPTKENGGELKNAKNPITLAVTVSGSRRLCDHAWAGTAF